MAMVAETTTGALVETAPAKVNLYLHVTGRRADGYHLLDSVAVFPGIGDRLEGEPARGLSLSIDGPFGIDLGTGADNLVLRAAEALAARSGYPGAALKLEKNVPVAAGIGGGSADAAAALRLLSRLWRTEPPAEMALTLGADVPVCLRCQPQRMEGIGERLTPILPLPRAHILLVNPLVGVPTGAVFQNLGQKNNPPADAMPACRSFEALISWLSRQRNDLEDPAKALCPPIAEVLDALSPAPLARMSGSGATCFALLPSAAAANRLAADLRQARPGWWIAAAAL